ncbi:hypothetical protein OS188_14590 [Xanthomarina sp. F1114]|uniref:hypothetical protein n=1 Tax=Xanthomarina sp. F1114 TaxID=2996019 RepID=UPI00225E4D8D|nr:hypothetical protein [Xanthomarina sp. F1114]MCX7549182.1 hypothetical protein [Xanthomarina sp. F1114]
MRKAIILIIGVTNLLVSLSCNAQYSATELKDNFTTEQISDLNKITAFFQNQICDNKNSDFKTCFSKILPELLEYGWQPILEKVDFEKQKELYNSISKSTFNEIWEFGKATYPKTGLELKSIGSKYNGKYQKYLTELGKNNAEIKEYAERLIAAGDFESMGLLQQQIYKNPNNFDLNNPNIQLLIAIHYLSQNDQQKRKEKWIAE